MVLINLTGKNILDLYQQAVGCWYFSSELDRFIYPIISKLDSLKVSLGRQSHTLLKWHILAGDRSTGKDRIWKKHAQDFLPKSNQISLFPYKGEGYGTEQNWEGSSYTFFVLFLFSPVVQSGSSLSCTDMWIHVMCSLPTVNKSMGDFKLVLFIQLIFVKFCTLHTLES